MHLVEVKRNVQFVRSMGMQWAAQDYLANNAQLDVDAESMARALNPNQKKTESKDIKSIRKRAVGIRQCYRNSIVGWPHANSRK